MGQMLGPENGTYGGYQLDNGTILRKTQGGYYYNPRTGEQIDDPVAWENTQKAKTAINGNLYGYIDSALQPKSNQFAGDLAQSRTRLDAYLASAAPTLRTDNRFDTALTNGQNRLNTLLDNPDSIQQTAGYKFRFGQGMEALQRSLAAKGLLNSGNRLQEMQKLGQDMASQEYDNQYNRLANLNTTNTNAWLGDKNANTAIYSAENAAHANRGNLLADLYGKSGSLFNSNEDVNNSNAYRAGSLWNAMNGKNTNQGYWTIGNTDMSKYNPI